MTKRIKAAVLKLLELKDAKKRNEQALDELSKEIKSFMIDNDLGEMHTADFEVQYATVNSTAVDMDTLRAEHPKLVEKYTMAKQTKRLTAKRR